MQGLQGQVRIYDVLQFLVACNKFIRSRSVYAVRLYKNSNTFVFSVSCLQLHILVKACSRLTTGWSGYNCAFARQPIANMHRCKPSHNHGRCLSIIHSLSGKMHHWAKGRERRAEALFITDDYYDKLRKIKIIVD